MFGPPRELCSDCGLPVPATVLESGEHVCPPERVVFHQLLKAKSELPRLEEVVREWERDPRLAKQIAFRRYLRDAA
jgi:hypothetical protein